jgi:F0F1-type ATP synthase assembly protein I
LVSDTTDKDKSKRYWPYADLGLRFAVSILIGIAGGYWLDNKFNTLPLFLILGLIFGMISGFLTLYRTVYPGDRADKDKGE